MKNIFLSQFDWPSAFQGNGKGGSEMVSRTTELTVMKLILKSESNDISCFGCLVHHLNRTPFFCCNYSFKKAGFIVRKKIDFETGFLLGNDIVFIIGYLLLVVIKGYTSDSEI